MSSLGNKQVMAKNIRYYMEKHGLNATDLALELDFKYSTVLDWLKANTYPRIDKIEMMANYFKIEKSDISEEVKQELQVKKISDKWNIYGTIIDINLPENEAIKEKWIDDINYYQKENKLQILLGLLFVGHIKFKSDRKIIQININNEFEELGTENKLSDLEPL